MAEIENAGVQETQDTQEKTYTQAEYDELVEKHQKYLTEFQNRIRHEYERKTEKQVKEARQKLEDEIKQAGMTEQEKLQTELDKARKALTEKEDIIAISSQKDETRAYLKELGIDESNLQFCFVPKDLEATKTKAKALKEMIDGVKKATFENNLGSTIPKTDGKPAQSNDLFLEGFNSK